MRTNVINTLESRRIKLKNKKAFYKELSLKHIPTFQVYLNSFLEKAQDCCNDACNDIDNQVKEIDEIIDDLCGLKIAN